MSPPVGSSTGSPGTSLWAAQTIESEAWLTPDALMAYCSTRLDQLGSQASEIFQQQENVIYDRNAISDLVNECQAYKSGADKDACAKLEKQLETTIASIKQNDPNSNAIPKLEKIHDQLMAATTGPSAPGTTYNSKPPMEFTGQLEGTVPATPPTPGDGTYYDPSMAQGATLGGSLSGDQVQSYITQIQQVGTDLGSQSDLQMIQLQTLASQRESAIQMTTNLMQSVSDSLNKITSNIGH